MTFPTRDEPELKRLLQGVLDQAPHDIIRSDTWLFVYGSMLEDPPFEAAERRIAVLEGYHRSFCLSDPMLRGTEDKPGLTLGLAPGGRCVGLAWRLSCENARDCISAFWSAEMALPLYQAVWQDVIVEGLGSTPALFLIVDPSSPLLQPELSEADVAKRIAACAGCKGSNIDYLIDAAEGLERAGVPDRALEALVQLVRNEASN